MLDDTMQIPASECWNCHKVNDACSGSGAPSEGNFTLCINCGCLSVFQADLTLRAPSDDELAESTTMPKIGVFRRAIMQTRAALESDHEG